MTRRIEAAKSAAPYMHARFSTTEFVPLPKADAITGIDIVLVNPSGKEVPWQPPPHLLKAATQPNAPAKIERQAALDQSHAR
jgi:hypothetical protein